MGFDDEKRKSAKLAGDGMEDISSDSSSDSATYSHLNSSSENDDKKSKDGQQRTICRTIVALKSKQG